MAALASANSLTRESEEITTTLIKGINSGDVNWDVKTKTILDEDTGIQSLRVTHILTANILATDVV
jgi:hypothetical protein